MDIAGLMICYFLMLVVLIFLITCLGLVDANSCSTVMIGAFILFFLSNGAYGTCGGSIYGLELMSLKTSIFSLTGNGLTY